MKDHVCPAQLSRLICVFSLFASVKIASELFGSHGGVQRREWDTRREWLDAAG